MRRKNSKLELSSIVDLSHLEALHDVFSEETDLATAILDEKARPITFERHFCSFCNEVRKTTAGVTLCRESDRHGIELAMKKKGPVFYHCKQGLVEFCTPITVDGKNIAFLFSGQFRCAEGEYKTSECPSLEELYDIADNTGENVDTEALKMNFQDVKVRDFKWAKNALERLEVQLNSFVKKLHEWKRVKVVDDFMEESVGMRTVDDLFDLIIVKLSNMMKARHCSIFTVQRGGTEEFDRLVLRKTSKKEKKSTYFNRGEGLTGWIWMNARPLRLRNVKNHAELVSYGYPIDHPKWEQKDCDESETFLGVPMCGRSDEVIGVITMLCKKPSGFDGHDTILLSFLARHLSWVIEYQTVKDKFQFVGGLLNAARELTSTQSYEGLLDGILKYSTLLFGGGKGKKYFVNTHKPGSQEWKIERIGGDLDLTKEWLGEVCPISEGLTGRVIREKQCILSFDLEKDKAQGYYKEATKDGKSAMAAPIQYRGKIYGVIAIVSNEFSFSREKELEILKIFAELCAVELAKIAKPEIAKPETAKKKENILTRLGRQIWGFIWVHILPELVKKWLER